MVGWPFLYFGAIRPPCFWVAAAPGTPSTFANEYDNKKVIVKTQGTGVDINCPWALVIGGCALPLKL